MTSLIAQWHCLKFAGQSFAIVERLRGASSRRVRQLPQGSTTNYCLAIGLDLHHCRSSVVKAIDSDQLQLG